MENYDKTMTILSTRMDMLVPSSYDSFDMGFNMKLSKQYSALYNVLNLKDKVRLAAISVMIMVLTSCASGPSNEELLSERARTQQQEAEQEKIQVTGSRVTDSDLISQLVPTASSAEQTLAEIVTLLSKTATNQSSDSQETAYIQERFARGQTLSPQEKEALYQLISQAPEQAGQIFKRYRVNPTISAKYNPVSTFSMDVDNASFKLAGAMLDRGSLPHPDGIRVEEFINALEYQYQHNGDVFSLSAEAVPSPFRKGYHLLHVGAQTQELNANDLDPSNLTLVIDISGSMDSDDKLPLLKSAMKTLVSQLGAEDKIAIVVYSDSADIHLKPTKVKHKRRIYKAIDRLQTEGSTNVEEGMVLAYEVAEEMYEPGFNNRVILTSDGMANNGARSPEVILRKITDAKNKGIFLTTLGVGTQVYNDHLLEQLANKGNGSYLYIANQDDVQRTFVDNLSRQLQTVAKDAKVQVSFDPNVISHYRLLGYENRHLETDDFIDPDKDGAEIGAGQKVTAIYEIKLVENTDTLGSQASIAKLAVSYKKPEGKKVFQISKSIPASVIKDNIKSVSPDSVLSFSAAAFAEKLRQSYWARFYDYDDIEDLIDELPSVYKRQTQVKRLEELISMADSLDTGIDRFESIHPMSSVSFERVPLLD